MPTKHRQPASKFKQNAKQQTFAPLKRPAAAFGGDLLKNYNAKVKRPLDSRLPVHLVLRSHKSVMRLPKNYAFVEKTIRAVFKKHGVTLYRHANVGNHLHFVLKIRSRQSWGAMIRELTGRIAYKLGQHKERYWVKLPFTRVVSGWRRAFKVVMEYVEINNLEACGRATREDVKILRELQRSWGWSTG